MTIKRRVRLALSLMMIGPFIFMMGAVGFTRVLSLGAGRFDSFGRPSLVSDNDKRFIAEINRLVNDRPETLADPEQLAALDDAFGKDAPDSWAVLRDGRAVYRSGKGRTDGEAHRLPGWPFKMMSRGKPEPDLTWNFRFTDGSAGALQLSLTPHWDLPVASGLSIAGFFVMLIVCNGLLGWWVSSGVNRPLARLRDAALRIGDGDLSFSPGPARQDEFGQVTAAFETMRQKLSAALQRQLEEEASRKELIAHVSHDLRTPINLIRGYAEGLRDGVAATPEMRARYLETILERSGELEKLIETLFAFSRLDLEGVRPKLEAVAIVPFLEHLRTVLAADYPNVSIAFLAPPDAPRVTADVELTRRAIGNLVENAVRHGGKPAVAMEWRLARAAGDRVELAVGDDGEGVTAEDRPRLFEPFFRADRSRTRGAGGGGAGLGLSIVGKIMAGQGGSARAGVSPAGGLEITLSFQEALGGTQGGAQNGTRSDAPGRPAGGVQSDV